MISDKLGERLPVKNFKILLFAFLIVSCSTLEHQAERYPAGGSSTSNFCRQVIRNLFGNNQEIIAEDLGSTPFYRDVIQKRENVFSKSDFTPEQLERLKRSSDFDGEKFANRDDLKYIDTAHLLIHGTEVEIQHHLKSMDYRQLRGFLSFARQQRLDFSDPNLFILLRRKPYGNEAKSFEEAVNTARAYYVSPRGEADTYIKQKDAYRIIVNRAEGDFDESKIPELIKYYRMNTEDLDKTLKRYGVKRLQALSELSRQFNGDYRTVLYFDIRGEEEYLDAVSDFGYVFGKVERILREKEEALVKKKEMAEAAKRAAREQSGDPLPDEELDKIVKTTELSVREDTFKFDENISDQDLVLSLLQIRSTGRLTLTPEPVKQALMKMRGFEDESMLLKDEIQLALMNMFRDNLPEEDVSYIMGNTLKATKDLLEASVKKGGWGSEDEGARDMHRGWAWRLLPDDDPAWKDPEYLRLSMLVTNASGGGLSAQDKSLYHKIKDLMMREWKKLDSKFYPAEFTTTGSDANNLLYAQALKAARRKHGDSVKDAEILFFDELYGGVRGKMAGVGYHGMGRQAGQSLDEFKLPTAKTYDMNPTDPEEIKRLDEVEADVLKQIREKVEKYAESDTPIGGLFFEAMQANKKGVNFFRPSFLLKVQELCAELRIPVMVDEIMAGGGRTGKMWSHEHYPDFLPDIITFGKGMQVAGVATRGSGPQGPVTQEAVVESMLKAWVVMKTINDRNLLENATEMGKYIVKRARELSGDVEPSLDYSYARGMGMMIWPGNGRGQTRGAEGRLFPYLTMTREEVDEVLPKPSN